MTAPTVQCRRVLNIIHTPVRMRYHWVGFLLLQCQFYSLIDHKGEARSCGSPPFHSLCGWSWWGDHPRLQFWRLQASKDWWQITKSPTPPALMPIWPWGSAQSLPGNDHWDQTCVWQNVDCGGWNINQYSSYLSIYSELCKNFDWQFLVVSSSSMIAFQSPASLDDESEKPVPEPLHISLTDQLGWYSGLTSTKSLWLAIWGCRFNILTLSTIAQLIFTYWLERNIQFSNNKKANQVFPLNIVWIAEPSHFYENTNKSECRIHGGLFVTRR